MFFKLPFHFILKTDLEAVKRLVNLPLASNLTPAILLYFKRRRTLFNKLVFESKRFFSYLSSLLDLFINKLLVKSLLIKRLINKSFILSLLKFKAKELMVKFLTLLVHRFLILM